MIDRPSHRTGLVSKNSLRTSELGHASLKRSAALPIISYLEKVYDFRERWLCSNWGWALADEVIETLSGKTWGTYLQEHIFNPLSMRRTITNHDTKLDNVAEAYMALSNGKPYHQGSNNTFLSSVHLLPQSHRAIVVLTNSMANSDAADWLRELLPEAVLNNPHPNDYLKLAEASAAESKDRWARTQHELDDNRNPNTSPRQLDAYCCSYWNVVNTYCLTIYRDGNELKLCFQNNHEYSSTLTHYHHDMFSWLLTREDDVDYGRFPMTCAEFYLLKFVSADEHGNIEAVTWAHDPAVPEGEIFRVLQSDREMPEAETGKEEVSVEGPV